MTHSGPEPHSRPLEWAVGGRATQAWKAILLLLMSAVCALAFDPDPPPAIDTGWDKGNHALAFAVLAGTAVLAFWHARRRSLGVALGLLIFGGFIELVQTQIPGRSGEWLDLAADGLGIAVGLVAMVWLRRRLRY